MGRGAHNGGQQEQPGFLEKLLVAVARGIFVAAEQASAVRGFFTP